MVRTFTDIEKLVGIATKLERVLGELGETPFKPPKGRTRRGRSKDTDGKAGYCFEQHTYKFLRGMCPILVHHPLPPCLRGVRSIREKTI